MKKETAVKRAVLAASVGVLALFAGACGKTAVTAQVPSGVVQVQAAEKAAAVKEEAQDTISVMSSGKVSAVPDKAQVTVGVFTIEKTAQKAQEVNAEKSDAVVAALLARGIEEKSIQTANYNIYPEYDYSKGDGVLTGYRVTNSLLVSDQSIDDIGGIITECVEAGANEVNDVRFYCSSYDDAYRQSMEKAIADAQAKAEAAAKAAGRELGRIVSIIEGTQDTSARYSNTRMTVEEAAMDSVSASMKVMPGETDIEARVTIVYELK
jgi:hypothetical protein